jgi:hypothetical protein
LESSRPGYAFVDAPAKQKAEDFIKQNKDKYKDEYFKTYFEQQNRLKPSNAANTNTVTNTTTQEYVDVPLDQASASPQAMELLKKL